MRAIVERDSGTPSCADVSAARRASEASSPIAVPAGRATSLSRRTSPWPSSRSAEPPRPLGPASQEPHAPPSVLGEPRHCAAGMGYLVGEDLPARQAEGRRHPVLVLDGEPFAAPTVGALELDAHSVQALPRRRQTFVGDDSADDRRDGCHEGQQLQVAEATTALLQVWLEQEGDLTVGLLGAPAGPQYLGQPLAHTFLPQAPHQSDRACRQGHVTRHGTRVKEPLGDTEVGLGGALDLGKGADAVVKGHRVVPDRVPEAVCHLDDVGAPVVDEEQVQVTAGSEVAAPQAPHCQECYASAGLLLCRAGSPALAPPLGRLGRLARHERLLEELSQPGIG